jgi:ribosomal protein S18 acetylase RimI-like enzyme
MDVYSEPLRFAPVGPDDGHDLGEFFEALASDPDTPRLFHPHPLTRAYARELCGRVGRMRDGYFLAWFAGRIVAYWMLRGWDEGYAVPSFGVAVHPLARGLRLGAAALEHAISVSRERGAEKLRLTVYRSNARALRVYRRFGFVFQDKNEQELVGLLDLGAAPEQRPVDRGAMEAGLAALFRKARANAA